MDNKTQNKEAGREAVDASQPQLAEVVERHIGPSWPDAAGGEKIA